MKTPKRKQVRNAERRKRDYYLLRTNPTRWAKTLAYQREWRRRNRERSSEQQRKYYRNHRVERWTSQIKHDFGMTKGEYDGLFQSQNGVCAICKHPETKRGPDGQVTKLQVDHDHTNGRIRGLLCGRCNRAIGLFGDMEQLLKSAWEYLRCR